MRQNNAFLRSSLFVGLFILLILLLDQWIKVYVKTHFELGEEYPLLGKWFVMEYIENRGMAFGTSFGNKAWHKLALSIFRILAVGVLVYYWLRYARQGKSFFFLLSFGLIIAGALGNLLDSMYYDYYFPYDPCFPYNIQAGSGIFVDCGFWGELETKPRGFLYGNVVDMFKFNATWPQKMPWIGGESVFPAIWNLADASITTGLLIILCWNRRFFPKEKKINSEQIANSQEHN